MESSLDQDPMALLIRQAIKEERSDTRKEALAAAKAAAEKKEAE